MKVLYDVCPSSLRRLTTILILVTALIGCNEDSGNIGDVENEDFTIAPGSINFPQVAIGESDVDTLRLSNRGQRSILLNSLQLRNSNTGSAAPFTILNPFEDGYELEGGEQLEVDIEYTPTESIRYGGVLSFGSNIPDSDIFTIDINAGTPQPELFASENINFTRTPINSTEWQLLEVSNIGYAPLKIESINFSGDSEFDLSFPVPLEDEALEEDQSGLGISPIDDDALTPPEGAEPGESFYVRVLFEAVDENFRSGVINITSNDPNREIHRVAVTANSNAPCLRIEESEVSFGQASIGHTTQQAVTITNCSDIAETVVTRIELTDDAEGVFGLNQASLPGQLAEGDNAVLGPQESKNFIVTYTPGAEQSDEGMLTIQSNDPTNGTIEAPVTGVGSSFECPVAIAQGRIIGTTRWEDTEIGAVPLDQIEFSSADSFDPDSTSLDFQWVLVNRPQNSGALFSPNDTVASPTLMVDIAGVYTVELIVTDGYGIATCEPARITIYANPDADIHVELTWEVASSPDGTGTDLDLHYRHQDGSWGQGSPWEIYYANRNEDWGSDGTVSLDIDNLYGSEPENINHDNPGTGKDYSVGVFYFSSRSWPHSDATIRIYLGGFLVHEQTQRLFAPSGNAREFWWVADIPWDGISLDIFNDDDHLDNVTDGFPN